MHNYFETTVKFEKTAEEGNVKTVTEKHIVDALSFTEAEARIIKEMQPFISGEFQVTAIKKIKINELFYAETGDKWFRGKIVFLNIDDKGNVKKTPATVFVNASDITQAKDTIHEKMKGTLADWELEAISETKIIEVFKYEN